MSRNSTPGQSIAGHVQGVSGGYALGDATTVTFTAAFLENLQTASRELWTWISELASAAGSLRANKLAFVVVLSSAAVDATNSAPATAGEPVITNVAQPSFDCRKASSWSEREVCGNAILAEMDAIMASFFRSKKAQIDSAQADVLTRDQKQWLRDRDNCHFSPAASQCLIDIYKKRISELAASRQIATPAEQAPVPVVDTRPATGSGGQILDGIQWDVTIFKKGDPRKDTDIFDGKAYVIVLTTDLTPEDRAIKRLGGYVKEESVGILIDGKTAVSWKEGTGFQDLTREYKSRTDLSDMQLMGVVGNMNPV